MIVAPSTITPGQEPEIAPGVRGVGEAVSEWFRTPTGQFAKGNGGPRTKEHGAAISAALKGNPNIVAANKRRWADPTFREKHRAAFSIGQRRRYARPEERIKTGAAMSIALKGNPKIVAAQKRRCADPAYRAKIGVAGSIARKGNPSVIAAQKRYCATPEGYAQKSRRQKQLWEDPTFRAKQVAAQKRRAATPEGRAQRVRAGIKGVQANTRNRPSSLEKAFMQMLDAWGVKYIHQKRIGACVVDFYLPREHLVVEVDGEYWHSRPGAQEKDRRRNAYLRRRGFRVVRLPEAMFKGYKGA